MKYGKPFIPVVILFVTVILAGTVGYRILEAWPWVDALYMAVITVTTVGFAEVHPLSANGRLFTAFLILLGVGALTYTLTVVTENILEGEIKGFLKERRMKRLISSLQQHYVICGYGEMGRQVAQELNREGCSIVVVDSNEAAVERAREGGLLAVHGDAGIVDVLREAGIERAAGVVVATDDDASNLLIVLSVRVLKSDLKIIARANLEEVTDKLIRAGADRVLFAQKVAGRRMAQMLLRPEICDFLDVMTSDESLELLLENFVIPKGSGLAGRTLRDAAIREKTGASIVGLKRPGIGIIAALKPTTPIQDGDTVFALGTREQIDHLSRLLGVEDSPGSGNWN